MEVYEFLVPGRPYSVHSKRRQARRDWLERLASEAIRASPGYPPFAQSYAWLTIVFLCDERLTIDVDNVIKPIQDALTLVFYGDDERVSDVEAHRRVWTEKLDERCLSDLLKEPWKERHECVYVRIQDAKPLEEHL